MKFTLQKQMFLLPVLLSVFSCTTLETYVEQADTDYVRIPVTKSGFFREQYHLGDYTLAYHYTNNNYYDTAFILMDNMPSLYKGTFARVYSFSKGGELLSSLDLVTQRQGIQGKNFELNLSNRFIHIRERGGERKNFSIQGGDKYQPYVVFDDPVLGEVKFDIYESKNRNAPDNPWTFHTGYVISVNGQKYGIFALYPAELYLSRSLPGVDERMARYILAVYASFKHRD